MSNCTKPCPECPFSRACPPGMLGGSAPERFIGQAYGPFLLPCHMAKGYSPEGTVRESPQCAGAAIFRANIGVDKLMPPAIHRLPADIETVFATPQEFIAHHCGVPVEVVNDAMSEWSPDRWLNNELRRNGVRVL